MPFGDGEMLGRTWQLAFVEQRRREELVEWCLAIATIGGRGVAGGHRGDADWTATTVSMPGLRRGPPG